MSGPKFRPGKVEQVVLQLRAVAVIPSGLFRSPAPFCRLLLSRRARSTRHQTGRALCPVLQRTGPATPDLPADRTRTIEGPGRSATLVWVPFVSLPTG